MNFLSQAGQDRFVHALLPKSDGTFAEIGCSHPTELSNTYALEQLGWYGLSVDCSEQAIELCQTQRSPRSRFCCADATTFDWRNILSQFPHMIDYASVDVDQHTHEALKRLLESGHGFRVVTLEHDQYQRGDSLRIPNREVMAVAGYDLVAADVLSNGCCFEDWYTVPSTYWSPEQRQLIDKFRSVGLDWRDVLRKGGVL